MRPLLVALLFLFTTAASGQVYIKVKGAKVKRAKVAISSVKPQGKVRDPRLAGLVAKQMREDLEFLALFDFLDPSLYANLDRSNNLYRVDYKSWSLLQASFVLNLGYKVQGKDLTVEAVFHDVPGGKKVFGKTYRYRRNSYKRLVHAISEDVLESVTGEKGLFFSKILMVCRTTRRIKSPPKEIYVVNPDGTGLKALTSDGTLSLSPSWSPDGKYISYTQFQYVGRGRGRRKAQVLKMHDLATGKRRILASQKGMNSGSSWSADGKLIAATMSFSGRPEIYFVSPFGSTQPQPLSRNIQWRKISGTGFHRSSASTLFDVEPDFSPDGKSVVISSRRTGHPMIYIVDLATKQARQLTFAGIYNSSPAWSPRGDKILFAAQMLAEGNFDLMVVDPDGNNMNRITGGGRKGRRRINYENPSWAPTGRHFVYASNETGKYAIYATTLDWSIHRRISPKGMECQTPSWGPAQN